MGNVLTRVTHFAHHSFYSKLVLKANILPALGFSLLLKHDKYLPVMSQGRSLWVCQICSTCVKWMFPPPDRENFSMSLQSLPKIPPWNGGKMLWGQKKTRPAMGTPQSHLRHPQNLSPGSSLHFPSPLPISSSAHHSPSPNFHTRLVSAFDENNSGLGHFILHWRLVM